MRLRESWGMMGLVDGGLCVYCNDHDIGEYSLV